jgi:hypothetical protein
MSITWAHHVQRLSTRGATVARSMGPWGKYQVRGDYVAWGARDGG